MKKYKTRGVCSTAITLEIEDALIRDLRFEGGCEGNLKGLCALAVGRPAAEVAELLAGTKCGSKKTSCPDQLAKVLKKILSARKS